MSDATFLPTPGATAAPLPPDVVQAIAHVRAGMGTEADRQVLIQYLATGNPDPTIAISIGNMIGAMGGGGPATSLGAGSPGATGGTDWVAEAQTQAQGGAPPSAGPSWPSLGNIMALGDPGGGVAPTGSAPPAGPSSAGPSFWPEDILAMGEPGGIGGGGSGGGPAPMAGGRPPFYSPSSGGFTPAGATPDTPAPPLGPALTGGPEDWKQYDPTRIGAPLDTRGVISPVGTPYDAQAERQRQRALRGRGGGGGEDWKGAYLQSDLNPDAAAYYANNPTALAESMYGSAGGAADFMTPQVKAAIALSKLGLHGHGGIGTGPSSDLGYVSDVHRLLDPVGQGQYIDPNWVQRRAVRSLANTPEAQFRGGSGNADWQNQIDVTSRSLMDTAGAFMNADGQQTLALRLDAAAQEWTKGMADGTMQMTFPQYLQSIGARRWAR